MTPADQARFPARTVTLRDGRMGTVRPLARTDAGALTRFYASVPAEDIRFYCPHPLDRQRAEENAAKAESPLEVVMVLEAADGELAGYAWFRWSSPDAPRSGFGICVRRGWQSAGAGRALIERIVEVARHVGPPVMGLTVQQANRRALALYRSVGFRVVREQIRRARPEMGFAEEPEYYMERTRDSMATCPDEGARRSHWREQMEAASSFIERIRAYPVRECGERAVPLPDAAAAAGVDVAFSTKPHALDLPRLFWLREGLIGRFLAAAREMNGRGWVMRVEDGYRTRAMQKHLARRPEVFRAILARVQWEAGSQAPDVTLVTRRVAALIAPCPKVGTHMSASAIDLSVLDRDSGQEVDRGAPYLEMSELTPMGSPFVSPAARANREAITALMARHGFVAYPWEFWHYNQGDAYDEHLRGNGAPARYGAVDVRAGDGTVTALPNPEEPLNTPEEIAAEIQRALRGAAASTAEG